MVILRCVLATCRDLACKGARYELVSVALVSVSVALGGGAGDDFSFIWRAAVAREALELLTVFLLVAAGAVGITLPERGRADVPVGLAGVGFVLAATAEA